MRLLRIYDSETRDTIEIIGVRNFTRGMTDKLIRNALYDLEMDLEEYNGKTDKWCRGFGGGSGVVKYINENYRPVNRKAK